jgi:hypothetical protein
MFSWVPFFFQAQGSFFSENCPGIQRGASRAGKAKESGARWLAVVRTSCPILSSRAPAILDCPKKFQHIF